MDNVPQHYRLVQQRSRLVLKQTNVSCFVFLHQHLQKSSTFLFLFVGKHQPDGQCKSRPTLVALSKARAIFTRRKQGCFEDVWKEDKQVGYFGVLFSAF